MTFLLNLFSAIWFAAANKRLVDQITKRLKDTIPSHCEKIRSCPVRMLEWLIADLVTTRSELHRAKADRDVTRLRNDEQGKLIAHQRETATICAAVVESLKKELLDKDRHIAAREAAWITREQ